MCGVQVVDRYLDGSSLASAAVYPDAYRSNVRACACAVVRVCGGHVASQMNSPAHTRTFFAFQGGAWSSSLHYVNFPRDATHYLPSYCGNPAQCVVAAVANYTRTAPFPLTLN